MTKTYKSDVQVLRVLDLLAGYVVNGISSTAVYTKLNISPSMATHKLQDLEAFGWARKDSATGLWHITPLVGQLFGKVLADFAKSEQHIADLKHNFTR